MDTKVRLMQRIEDLSYTFSVETMGEDGERQYTCEEVPSYFLAVIEYFMNIIDNLHLTKSEPSLSDLDVLTNNTYKIMRELDCNVDQALAIIKYNSERGGSV